jgi:hypothetical protein
LDPDVDLRAATTAAIERLAGDGWQPEGGAEYGSVFVRRGNDRRLLMLTALDPGDKSPQSFSLFGRQF